MTEPREFLIDMTLPAEERWQDVIASSRRSATKLARWVLSSLERVPLSHVIRGAIVAGHRQMGSLYDDDVSAWAAGLGMPHRDLIAINAAYELAQLGDAKIANVSILYETPGLGVAHPVDLAVPAGVDVNIEQASARGNDTPAKLTVSGPDKQKVGDFAATIRRTRPPEPYHGKGVRYADEQVRRKEGKAFGSGA